MPAVYMAAYGCQMNVLDAERVLDTLSAEGWSETPSDAEADLYLVNTCSVREHAEDRIRALAGRLRGWKAGRAGRRIGVLGCMAQRERDEMFRRMPQIDSPF